jgi:hypothetical protein
VIPNLADAWRPQKAPQGFAERAAAAVLRDRAVRRSSSRSRRWVVLLSAASLLAGGAAWAWRMRPVETPTVTHTVLVSAAVASQPTVELRTSSPIAPVVKAPAVVPVRKVPPAASASSVALPTKLILPRCTCNEFACDCGPEP